MKQATVLVFPCGSEVGLEINQALKDIAYINLIGASSVEDHGCFAFENYVGGLPHIDDPQFIECLNEILSLYNVDFIYPAMDQVVDVLSEHRNKLRATLLAPEHNVVHICRNKRRTYEALKDEFFLPKIYDNIDLIKEYPVIIKPEEGYGSKGFHIVKNKDDLVSLLQQSTVANVICEYLPGDEYTVDCFTDRCGTLKYVNARIRGRIRNGISVYSRTIPENSSINQIALRISALLEMRGAWFFQLKKDGNGNFRLLEVATRVAGTMCLERAQGVNLPLLTVLDFMNYEVAICKQFNTAIVDRALQNVFSLPINVKELWIDFDDTIIIRNQVNLRMISFLYHCVNRNIPITLITKHEGDLIDTIHKYRIDEFLFDRIVHITKQERKCDQIAPKSDGVLFIDDSFSERIEMQAKYPSVTVLGVESVDALTLI